MSYEEELNVSFATESLVFALREEDIRDFIIDDEDISSEYEEDGTISMNNITTTFESRTLQRAIEFGEDLIELPKPDTVEISEGPTSSLDVSSFMRKYKIDTKWEYFIKAMADDYQDVSIDDVASIFSKVYNTKMRSENKSTIAAYNLDFALIDYLTDILEKADFMKVTSEDELVDYSFYINKRNQPTLVLNTVADIFDDEVF